MASCVETCLAFPCSLSSDGDLERSFDVAAEIADAFLSAARIAGLARPETTVPRRALIADLVGAFGTLCCHDAARSSVCLSAAIVEGASQADRGPAFGYGVPVPYNPSQATGNGVDGWVSTPYDVAVGGTDFGDAYTNTISTYWAKTSSAKTDWKSAKSYIPEIPWNDTCASTLIASYYGFALTYDLAGFCNSKKAANLTLSPITGTNGGPSTCATGDLSLGTCKGYPKPSWQRGFIGIPVDGVHDVPDVSMFASDGAAWNQSYALCYSDPRTYGTPCKGDPGKWAGPGNGGTSFSAPIVAGIQALINQKMNGAAQGNPNYVYYKLAAREYGANGFSACSSTKGNMISPYCVFYDVTVGDNDMDCANAVDCFRPSGVVGVELAPGFKSNANSSLAISLVENGLLPSIAIRGCRRALTTSRAQAELVEFLYQCLLHEASGLVEKSSSRSDWVFGGVTGARMRPRSADGCLITSLSTLRAVTSLSRGVLLRFGGVELALIGWCSWRTSASCSTPWSQCSTHPGRCRARAAEIGGNPAPI